MKKNFCKVRRGHCLSLVWIVSFLLWGNVTMAALPIQEAKLSIQQRSVALSRVFYEIEKQTGYSFLVRNNDIRKYLLMLKIKVWKRCLRCCL